jgi:phage baseplate assembly protein V
LDSFLNLLKANSAQLDQGWAQPRLATVTSVDPATYTARVTIQPEGVLSGWLPVTTIWSGNGWGVACPVAPGDQVAVLWQEGDSQQGFIVGRLWSNAVPPPNAPSGELWLIHRSGSYLKLHNDGSIESNSNSWTHIGNFKATGDVSDGHGALSALRGHYNIHTHPPANATPTPTD